MGVILRRDSLRDNHNMSNRKPLFTLLALWAVLALAFVPFAAPVLAKPTPCWLAQAAAYEQIDAYIQRQMARLNIPGASLAIVEASRSRTCAPSVWPAKAVARQRRKPLSSSARSPSPSRLSR